MEESSLLLTKITELTNRDDSQNVIALSFRVINLVLEMLLCGGLSSRNVVSQGVGDSTSEILSWDVGFPCGCFVSRV